MTARDSFDYGRRITTAALWSVLAARTNPSASPPAPDTTAENILLDELCTMAQGGVPGIADPDKMLNGVWYAFASATFTSVYLTRTVTPRIDPSVDAAAALTGLRLTGAAAEAVHIARDCADVNEYVETMATAHPPYSGSLRGVGRAAVSTARVALDALSTDYASRLATYGHLVL